MKRQSVSPASKSQRRRSRVRSFLASASATISTRQDTGSPPLRRYIHKRRIYSASRAGFWRPTPVRQRHSPPHRGRTTGALRNLCRPTTKPMLEIENYETSPRKSRDKKNGGSRSRDPRSIRPREDHAAFGVHRNVSDGRLGLVFDALFAFTGTAPVRPKEASLAIKNFVELGIIINPVRMFFPELARPLEQRLLDGLERIQNSLGETLLGSRAFLAVIPPCQNDLIFLQIFGAHLDAERHSAFFPVVEFPAGTVLLARIDFEADSCGLEG